ncbi:hypothetical protein EGH22_00235 [Halomicroarcula sp. F28]|uniref:hypothetical protein n=1 Tax=Haloarcula salinisoli TaxID=2487746 RepID=UPI001C739E3E|nr:hypothetical protein [Halomicroarcula salinisoli]MBX0284744.1 hypothetical protein [Halomicroarcula salinisoli]
MDRRQYVASLFTAVGLGLAGCSADSNDSDGSTESSQDDENTEDITDTQNSTDSEAEETTENEQTSSSSQFETNIIAPESADLGESITIEIEVTNTGSQPGTWTGLLEVGSTAGPEPEPDAEGWNGMEIELDIPPGETRTWTSDEGAVERPLITYYRLDGGEIQSIEFPGSREPIIETVNLISEWNSYGDAVDNEISSAQVGDTINIAARYWYWVENQTVEAFRQFEIYNQSGDRVGIDTSTFEQVTQSNGWQSWESYSTFYTSDWDSGTHTARIAIRDEQNQEVSEIGTTEFELY